MKISGLALALVASLALPGTSSAQNTVKLLDPVNIAVSSFPYGVLVPPDEAVEFASKQLYLQCEAGATASVIGPGPGGSLIVDDFIRVQGPTNQATNHCVGSCFGEPFIDPMSSLGQLAESSYGLVAPVNVSSSLETGLGLYTFSLMDVSYTYTSTELSLDTSCIIQDKVCHFDSGKKVYKTLRPGAAAIPVHVSQHPGDYLGACIEQ